MKSKPLQFCVRQSIPRHRYGSDFFDAKPNESHSRSFLDQLHVPPRLICSLGPQSQALSTELRTTAKRLNTGCTAVLIIQFVAKQLPV